MVKRKLPSKKARLATRDRAAAAVKSSGTEQKTDSGETAEHQAFLTASGVRETIESVVVAFVLAFLFRTFEAEAFVIPTGSMAPTLMGRHKDIDCPICGYSFQVSASSEVDSASGALTQNWVDEGVCPMCRYRVILGSGPSVLKDYPSYSGDRILVNKFAYHVSEPNRWDVAVFRYPGHAQTNYIKRIVGLPGETLRISNGDIYVGKTGDETAQFEIARKPPRKLQAMLQTVFDNDVMPQIAEHGFSDRWRLWTGDSAGIAGADSSGTWQVSQDRRTFATDGNSPSGTWLRYEHRVPSRQDWREYDYALRRHEQVSIDPEPQLIRDFCPYNSSEQNAKPSGNHWVGDLALKCTVEIESDSGEAIFELVEGGWAMQCGIDLATGDATLTIQRIDASTETASTLDGEPYRLTAPTTVRGPGQYEIFFANVDDQLRLWIDGDLVEFGPSDEATCYRPLLNVEHDDYDLAPVGIASQGVAMKVSHLQVKRDVYYEDLDQVTHRQEFHLPIRRNRLPGALGADLFEDTSMPFSEFPLQEDQFFALGDNSPKSMDARLWTEKYVDRSLLIGKAFFIYWPDTHYKLPLPRFSVPVFPNFSDMGFVR